MPASRKSSLPKVIDLPLVLAVVLTVGFYLLVTQESLKDSMLAHYTTEHTVEYVIVHVLHLGPDRRGVSRAASFPGENAGAKAALAAVVAGGASRSRTPAMLLAQLQKKPRWLQESRIGQRLTQALIVSEGKRLGRPSSSDHLRYLAELDEEKIARQLRPGAFYLLGDADAGLLGHRRALRHGVRRTGGQGNRRQAAHGGRRDGHRLQHDDRGA